MIVDSFDYIACYKGLHPNLDKAIDWLNSHTLDALENGKTIIDGENVFVNVMDADPASLNSTYLDKMQVMIGTPGQIGRAHV